MELLSHHRRHPLTARGCGMVMMRRKLENSAVSPFSALQEPRHASHRRSACTCLLRNFPIGFALNHSLCNFKSFTPCLKFRERADIAQEICDFSFVLARCDCRAEGPEPGVLSPVAFGEAFLSHNYDGVLPACRP